MNAVIITNESALTVALAEMRRMPPLGVLVLAGEDRAQKKRFIEGLEGIFFPDESAKEWNMSAFYPSDGLEETESVVADCYTPGFGGATRLVLVEEYDTRKDLSDILLYAERPERRALLALTTRNALKDDVAYKKIGVTEFLRYVEFPAPKQTDLRVWLQDFFKSKKKMISRDALDYLMDAFRDDFEGVRNAAAHILSFNEDAALIDFDDVKDFARSEKRDVGFEFCEALMEGNAARAFALLRRMDKTLIELQGLLAYKFVTLYYMKLFPGGTSPNDMAKAAGVHPYAAKMDMKYLSRYSAKELSYIIKELHELSRRAVTAPKYAQEAAFASFIRRVTSLKDRQK